MAERTLRGMKIGANSMETETGVELAPRIKTPPAVTAALAVLCLGAILRIGHHSTHAPAGLAEYLVTALLLYAVVWRTLALAQRADVAVAPAVVSPNLAG